MTKTHQLPFRPTISQAHRAEAVLPEWEAMEARWASGQATSPSMLDFAQTYCDLLSYRLEDQAVTILATLAEEFTYSHSPDLRGLALYMGHVIDCHRRVLQAVPSFQDTPA